MSEGMFRDDFISLFDEGGTCLYSAYMGEKLVEKLGKNYSLRGLPCMPLDVRPAFRLACAKLSSCTYF